MLCTFGKGRLGMEPEQKLNNASGKYYKVRIAVNRMVKKASGSERETLWCSGLVHEGKISYQMDRLKKGAHVTFMSNKSWIAQWENRQGVVMADIDLGFLALIETGGEQEGDQQQTQTSPAPAPTQAPASMPTPAHVYAPAPAPAQEQRTQIWNGKDWVAAPPQQSAVSGQVPAPQIQKDSNLPF